MRYINKVKFFMIERYSREEMATIWSEESKYQYWLQVELAAAEAMAEFGIVSSTEVQACKAKVAVNIQRLKEIERTSEHEMVAFLQVLEETIGPAARCLHFGLTSNDIIDTAFSLQLQESIKLIQDGLHQLKDELKLKAISYKNTASIGRTHGMHAEPTTLGLKFLSWYAECSRAIERLKTAAREVNSCKLSGAVGTFSHISPEVEKAVAMKLNLAPEPISTQIVPRDRHAIFFSVIAILGSSIERWATEIRHLQRTEIGEIEEPFSERQRGSSAMPHKRNPILSENLCGLARVLRSYALASLENICLWHERDISHSSVERVIAPDACILIDFMIHRFLKIVKQLKVNDANIKKNLDSGGKFYASQALLLSLLQSGMQRSPAYKIVQELCFKSFESKIDLETLAKKDDRLKLIEINQIFDIGFYLKNIEKIYEKVFQAYP